MEELAPYRNSLDEYVYEGEWLNMKPEGAGNVYYPTGEYLQGEFHAGHPCGLVRMFYVDGSYFEGQVVDYLASGSGKFVSDDLQFDGVFVGSRPHSGIIKTKDNIVNSFNLSTLKGSIKWPTKKKYSGDLSLSLLPEGTGRLTFNDGSKLQGEWKAGHFLNEIEPSH